jgi:hypothetical protein
MSTSDEALTDEEVPERAVEKRKECSSFVQ